MQEMQKDKWAPNTPDTAKNQLLWMMIEVGETAYVVKKKGDQAIMNDEEIRRHFIEEMCDTLMYLNDVMLCYGIAPQELREAYLQKYQVNMNRW